MRASSYIIYVDLPGNSEEMLLLHGYNSGYDKVSRRVASYVRSLESRRPPKPLYGSWSSEPVVSAQVEAPSDETVQTLRRRGYLTDMTVEEEEEFFSKFARKLHGRSLKSMPNYIFMPTYNCNLRCAYCFQDYMRTDLSHQHLLKPMSLEIVDRIFCGIRHIDQAHEVNIDRSWVRSFGFFGGEPLLAANRGVVQYIMKKALEFGPTRFWAVSNATEIDAYEDLLSPAGIYRIQVTLDGPANEHDKRRVYADGSGCEAVGVARVISPSEVSKKCLISEMQALLKDRNVRKATARLARAFAKIDGFRVAAGFLEGLGGFRPRVPRRQDLCTQGRVTWKIPSST